METTNNKGPSAAEFTEGGIPFLADSNTARARQSSKHFDYETRAQGQESHQLDSMVNGLVNGLTTPSGVKVVSPGGEDGDQLAELSRQFMNDPRFDSIRARCNARSAHALSVARSYVNKLRLNGRIPDRIEEEPEDGEGEGEGEGKGEGEGQQGEQGKCQGEQGEGGQGQGQGQSNQGQPNGPTGLGKRELDEAFKDASEAVDQADQVMDAIADISDDPANDAIDLMSMQSPAMKDFLRIVGSATGYARSARKGPSFDPSPRLAYGSNFAQADPVELALLGTCLRDDVIKRAQDDALTIYDDSPAEGERGPMIIGLDVSGSMRGARFTMAAAVTCASMIVAHEDGRDVKIVPFGSYVRGSFEVPASTPKGQLVKTVKEIFSVTVGGGTDFTGVQEQAREFADLHEGKADLLMITDGSGSSRRRVKEDPKYHGIFIGSTEDYAEHLVRDYPDCEWTLFYLDCESTALVPALQNEEQIKDAINGIKRCLNA